MTKEMISLYLFIATVFMERWIIFVARGIALEINVRQAGENTASWTQFLPIALPACKHLYNLAGDHRQPSILWMQELPLTQQ